MNMTEAIKQMREVAFYMSKTGHHRTAFALTKEIAWLSAEEENKEKANG